MLFIKTPFYRRAASETQDDSLVHNVLPIHLLSSKTRGQEWDTVKEKKGNAVWIMEHILTTKTRATYSIDIDSTNSSKASWTLFSMLKDTYNFVLKKRL